jgi:arabinose-5-phosphate isomerase
MTSSTTDFAAIGRRVIRREAEALGLLAETLDGAFADAVGLILSASGRVIVCGMGKSGHVGRKIAATLASTGTPAQFVHPAEASHGDLGMVTSGDVALVLSNSGETPELADIIAHTRRFGIPLIGVAGRAGSTLLRQADVALLRPNAPEACDQGIVPTTSTTMTLALGDALAIALMEHRRFTPDQFRVFHPGGKLGAKLATVAQLMHDDPPLVPESQPMTETLLEMTRRGFGVVGVTDAAGLLTHSAGEVMTAKPKTIAPDALAQQALALMQDRKITSLFVVDPAGDGRALGLIHVHDCLRAGVA